MHHKTIKVVVSGAAGRVGEAFVFRLASGEVFGNNVDLELGLLETPNSVSALAGLQMELEDCAFPVLRKIICTSNLKEAMLNANWVILIGAMPRKIGMERNDLLACNGEIFSQQGKAINDYAAKDVKILVVGNPCNTNALIAMNNAPNIPKENFFAMTMLDELRAKALISKKAHCKVDEIKKLAIWGNHSLTQYPDFYQSDIAGGSVLSVIKDEKWLQTDFMQEIQKRGGDILKIRGVTSAGSAANAVVVNIKKLINETAKDDFYSIAKCSNGEYGIDNGLFFSFPCITRNNKVEVVTGLLHNQYALGKIQYTLQELRKEKETVQLLGFV